MIRYLLVTTFILLQFAVYAQEKITLNGYVKDALNGEELIGVSVYLPQLKAGTTTNAYGFYSITVAKGTYDIQFTYIGYKQNIASIDLTKDVAYNVEMETEATMIKEVVINDKAIDANVVDVQMSKNT